MDASVNTVSVVVATNRTSPFLAEALESAVAQSLPPLEIIVIDDGSPDPTAIDEAVAGLSAVRVVHRASQGVSASRNAGAALARGRWIAFLDDDDRWHQDRLRRQLANLQAMPDAVVGYCGLRTVDAEGVALARGEHIQVEGRLDVLRQRTGILVPNSIILRDAFGVAGGFDEGIKYAEDLDLMIRLAALGSLVLTPEDLVDYRLHAGNTTRNYRRLCSGVNEVLERHRGEAQTAGDAAAAEAATVGLKANERYAWWSAARAIRGQGVARHPVASARELAWAFRFAPGAPVDALRRRLGG